MMMMMMMMTTMNKAGECSPAKQLGLEKRIEKKRQPRVPGTRMSVLLCPRLAQYSIFCVVINDTHQSHLIYEIESCKSEQWCFDRPKMVKPLQ